MVEIMRHRANFSLLGTDNVKIDEDGDAQQTLVLIVLNYHLPSFTPTLWQQVRLRVCADGGANRLFDELPKFLPHEDEESVRHRYKPDVIIGDLDSLRPDVREFYSKLGTTVVDQSYDQETTDLEKSINFVRNSTLELETGKLKLLAVGALEGRFDHVAAHINVLYKFPSLRIILLSDESLLYLLPKGYSHEISFNTTFEGPHCGLIPFGTTSESTTTTGLQWNLSNTKMSFGSLVSTSNLLLGDFVTVVSDTHLVWTEALRIS
ncbi:unnamed protein product [Calypogeia fissa]